MKTNKIKKVKNFIGIFPFGIFNETIVFAIVISKEHNFWTNLKVNLMLERFQYD